jgi:ABC-type lipoprotein export system ATPase subunit
MVTHDPRYARHAERHIYLFDGQLADGPTVEPPLPPEPPTIHAQSL